MKRGKVMKTSHGYMNPKSSPTLRDRDAPFPTHFIPDQINKCEQNHTIRPVRFTAPDHDSTPELSIFNAHKYFNEVTNNNSSNSRVSPLLNMNSAHKHNPERGRDITKASRSYSFASSSVDGYANTRNYRAHSFHAATTPTAASSSESSCYSQACLVPHPPTTSAVSVSTTRNYSSHPQNSTNLKTKNRASSWSRPIWLLRRKCPCSCKESVQVNQTTPNPNPKPKTPITAAPPLPQPQPQPLSLDPKTPTITNNETAAKLLITPNEAANPQRFQPAMNKVARMPIAEGFTFPALAATTSGHGKKHVLKVVHEEDPIPPRHSLEVFQPITVDRDHRNQNLPSPPDPQSRANMDVDDAASDASSDLFEIESFSAQGAALPCPIRAPTVTECNEPKHTDSFDLSLAAGDRSSRTGSGSECGATAAEQHRQGATNITTTAL